MQSWCLLYCVYYIVYIGIYIVGIYILIYRTTRGRLGSTNRSGRRLIAISLLIGPMATRFDWTTWKHWSWVWAKTNVVLMLGSNLLVNIYPIPWTLSYLDQSHIPQALCAWRKKISQYNCSHLTIGEKNQLSTSWISFTVLGLFALGTQKIEVLCTGTKFTCWLTGYGLLNTFSVIYKYCWQEVLLQKVIHKSQ